MKLNNHKGLALISLLLASSLSYADMLTGRVVGVADGDTITVLDSGMHQHKIRLAGIDAPEKAQAFGQVSKKSLSDMVYGKSVDVEYTEEDRYQRKVGKVLIDNTDVNLEQVKLGYAWHYKKYQKTQSLRDRELYSRAESTASANKFGLWIDSNPVEPWNFRRNRKNSQ